MALFSQQTRFSSRLIRLVRSEDGQTVTEYAVVMGVITLVALASLATMSGQTLEILRRVLIGLR
jgi:Flp pilus assembly pilin Flp